MKYPNLYKFKTIPGTDQILIKLKSSFQEEEKCILWDWKTNQQVPLDNDKTKIFFNKKEEKTDKQTVLYCAGCQDFLKNTSNKSDFHSYIPYLDHSLDGRQLALQHYCVEGKCNGNNLFNHFYLKRFFAVETN